MRWIDQARMCALRYPQNKKEAGIIKRYSRKNRKACEIRSRGVAKPVEAAVIAMSDDNRLLFLQREIDAVDHAMRELEKIANNERESIKVRQIAADAAKLAKLTYVQGSHTLQGSANALFLAEATAYRYNKLFLKLILKEKTQNL